VQRYIFREEMQAAPAPPPLRLRPSTCVGPVICTFGTQAQKERFLPRIRQSRRLVVPGLLRAGRGFGPRRRCETTAERDGDHYVVNGQKTWTTLAQHADWIFCLVRTDPTREEAGGHLLPADRHEDAGHHRARRSSRSTAGTR
jgi:alkylation response protein AidB-like acyl-CoA dehydrogenase